MAEINTLITLNIDSGLLELKDLSATIKTEFREMTITVTSSWNSMLDSIISNSNSGSSAIASFSSISRNSASAMDLSFKDMASSSKKFVKEVTSGWKDMKEANIKVLKLTDSSKEALEGMKNAAADVNFDSFAGGAIKAEKEINNLSKTMSVMTKISFALILVEIAMAFIDMVNAAVKAREQLERFKTDLEVAGSRMTRQHLSLTTLVKSYVDLYKTAGETPDKMEKFRKIAFNLSRVLPQLSSEIQNTTRELDLLPSVVKFASVDLQIKDWDARKKELVDMVDSFLKDLGVDKNTQIAISAKISGDSESTKDFLERSKDFASKAAKSMMSIENWETIKVLAEQIHNGNVAFDSLSAQSISTRKEVESNIERIASSLERPITLANANSFAADLKIAREELSLVSKATNIDTSTFEEKINSAEARLRSFYSTIKENENKNTILSIQDANKTEQLGSLKTELNSYLNLLAQNEELTEKQAVSVLNLSNEYYRLGGELDSNIINLNKVANATMNAAEKNSFLTQYGSDAEKTEVIIKSKLIPALEAIKEKAGRLELSETSQTNAQFNVFATTIKDIEPSLTKYISKIKDVGKFMQDIDGQTPAQQLKQFKTKLEEIRDIEIKNDFLLKYGNDAEKMSVVVDTKLAPSLQTLEEKIKKTGVSAESLAEARFDYLQDAATTIFPDLADEMGRVSDKQDFLKDIDFKNPGKALQDFIDNLKKLRDEQDSISDAAAVYQELSESTREMANIMGQASMIADAFGAAWSQALAQVADGLLMVSDGFAQMASGDYMAAAASFAQGMSNVYSATLGRDGLWGSGQYDDAHVESWARGIGLNDPGIIADTQARVSQLRDSGYDKFEARKIAEMEAIPAAIEALGKLDSAQVDKMFWSIAHGIEELGNNYGAWKAAIPSIIPLLDQVDGSSVQMTDHLASLVSGLMNQGLATDEVLEKALKFADADNIHAWMSEVARGAEAGKIKLEDFARQFVALVEAADAKGIYADGQIQEMVNAANSMGWSMEEITSSIQDSVNAVQAEIDAVQQNIADINKQIEDARLAIDSARASRWDFNHYRKKEIEATFKEHIGDDKSFKWVKKTELDPTDPNSNGKHWQRERFRGQDAFKAINENIQDVTGGKRAMTFKEMREMVQGVEGKENKEALMEYLKGQNEGLRIQEQIENAKKQVEFLKDQRELQKSILNQHNNRLERIKTVLDKIRDNTTPSGKYHGGLMESRRYYEIAERGPEFIMSNNALSRYGLDFMESVNNGSYSPVETQVIAPVTTSNPTGAGNLNVTASVNGNNQIVINTELDGQAVGKAITFDVVRDRLIPMIDEARGAGY